MKNKIIALLICVCMVVSSVGLTASALEEPASVTGEESVILPPSTDEGTVASGVEEETPPADPPATEPTPEPTHTETPAPPTEPVTSETQSENGAENQVDEEYFDEMGFEAEAEEQNTPELSERYFETNASDGTFITVWGAALPKNISLTATAIALDNYDQIYSYLGTAAQDLKYYAGYDIKMSVPNEDGTLIDYEPSCPVHVEFSNLPIMNDVNSDTENSYKMSVFHVKSPAASTAAAAPAAEEQIMQTEMPAAVYAQAPAENQIQSAPRMMMKSAPALQAAATDEATAVEQSQTPVFDLMNATLDEKGFIKFDTDSFSPYIIGFTVDFHYEGTDYSIEGLSDILLSELFVQLGIDRNVADVTNVEFTNPELVSVTQEGSDWRLTSLQAFDTDETLTVTFVNGDVVTVKVTDAGHDAANDATDQEPSGLNSVAHIFRGIKDSATGPNTVTANWYVTWGGDFKVKVTLYDFSTGYLDYSYFNHFPGAGGRLSFEGTNEYWYRITGFKDWGTALHYSKTSIAMSTPNTIGGDDNKRSNVNVTRYPTQVLDNNISNVKINTRFVKQGDVEDRIVQLYVDGVAVPADKGGTAKVMFPKTEGSGTLHADEITVSPKAGYVHKNTTTSGKTYNVYLETLDVNYTIKYYKDIVTNDGDTSHYLGAVTKQAKTGTTINLSDNDLNAKRPNNYDYSEGKVQGTGPFTVAGDGSTVINVLYDPLTAPFTIYYYKDDINGTALADCQSRGLIDDPVSILTGTALGQLNYKKPLGYKSGVLQGSPTVAADGSTVAKILYEPIETNGSLTMNVVGVLADKTYLFTGSVKVYGFENNNQIGQTINYSLQDTQSQALPLMKAAKEIVINTAAVPLTGYHLRGANVVRTDENGNAVPARANGPMRVKANTPVTSVDIAAVGNAITVPINEDYDGNIAITIVYDRDSVPDTGISAGNGGGTAALLITAGLAAGGAVWCQLRRRRKEK